MAQYLRGVVAKLNYVCQFSETYEGLTYFNTLDEGVVNSIFLPLFKSKLKSHILKTH